MKFLRSFVLSIFLLVSAFLSFKIYQQEKNNQKLQNASNKNYLLVKAFLEDSFLDYTVDAAGIYRMNFKFREAIDE